MPARHARLDAGGWFPRQLAERLASTKEKLKRSHTPAYLASLEGSMGVDPALYTCKGNNYVA